MAFTYTYGTNGNDILNGRSASITANRIMYGYGGNDDIYGGNGDDYINGGAGDDAIYLYGGENVVDGGPGYDRIAVGWNNYVDYNEGVTVNLHKKGWQYTGESWLKIKNIEWIVSMSGDDFLTGNRMDNVLDSGDGHDWLDGGKGGIDTLLGGGGEDTFVMNKGKGHAIVGDYSFADDWIYFKGNSRRLGIYDSGNDAELWNGNDLVGVFGGAAGSELVKDGGGYFYLA